MISSINQVQLHQPQLETAISSLKIYLGKYQGRMAPKNVKTIKDMCRILVQLKQYMCKIDSAESSVDIMDLLVETDLYNYDFEKLHSFFDKADLIKKLNGFMQCNVTVSSQTPFSRSILYQIKEFIRILSLNPADGKFILRSKPHKSIEYLCLNPALHLKRLMDRADKIILASGTLEPTEEYDVLDKYVSEPNFMYKFACDHVITQDNYKVVALGSFNQHQFDFRYATRDSPGQLSNLVALI